MILLLHRDFIHIIYYCLKKDVIISLAALFGHRDLIYTQYHDKISTVIEGLILNQKIFFICVSYVENASGLWYNAMRCVGKGAHTEYNDKIIFV